MSWYDQKLGKPSNLNDYCNNSDTLVTFNMIITNLNTIEDYNSISKILKTINGIESVGPYNHKKLSIKYNQNLTNIEHIIYKLSQMGYRYINRF